jgi:DNA excision repair protein ERCC-3
MSNAKDDAFEAVIGIVEERKRRADEYVSKLRQLESMRVLEVDNVQRDGVETVYDFETESGTFLANGVLTHNCHHIPSPIYRLSADLQSKARLGLTATPVRGDDRETEIFTLVGPPIGTDWDKLFDAGYVAEPEVEVRLLPWADEESRNVWANAEGRERHQLAATNPRKVEEIRRLRDDHPEAKALIFVDWLKQGNDIAETLGLPFVSGETPHHERRRLFREFREGDRRTLIVSRVGDEGIDLPSAELAIVASGLGGSRRQGAQRAGRTMRPTGSALVYVLATRGTSEENFAERQTRHLSEKGVRVRERTVAADDE